MSKKYTNSAPLHFPGYDGNGNVVALVKIDGSVAARYEYGPYGEPLRVTANDIHVYKKKRE